MTEIQEPKLGIPFRDPFPPEVQVHESPQAAQPQGHYLTHSQGRTQGTLIPPLEFGGLVLPHFLNFRLDLTLDLDPSTSHKWLFPFHEPYQDLYKKTAFLLKSCVEHDRI